jgi:DNA-directed RNA polymerase subunit omega
MNDSMINPSIVQLLNKVDNRYSLITVTSKRARQIIEGAKPLINIESDKALTIAINEVDKGEITYKTMQEGIK